MHRAAARVLGVATTGAAAVALGLAARRADVEGVVLVRLGGGEKRLAARRLVLAERRILGDDGADR